MGKNAWIPPLELYCSLMEEVKGRVAWVQAACGNQLGMPAQVAREFAHLQIRLICEIIAIGCLAIHNDTSDVKSLEKAWSANEIMPGLEKLNPHFFPIACFVRPTTGPVAFNIEDINPKPFNKTEFLSMYGRCGGTLHRGHLRRIISSMPAQSPRLDDALDDVSRIVNLLRQHRIASANYQKHYVCTMENTPGGKCVIITAEGWSPIPPSTPAGLAAAPSSSSDHQL